MKHVAPDDVKEDNLLLELEKAVQLADSKRLAVLPLFIGARRTGSSEWPRFNFELYGGHQFPTTGSKTEPSGSVRNTINSILAHQGIFLSGLVEGRLLWKEAASDRGNQGVAAEIVKVDTEFAFSDLGYRC